MSKEIEEDLRAFIEYISREYHLRDFTIVECSDEQKFLINSLNNINSLLQKNKELEEENKELMKLKKDHNYSVDVVRQNTKLRYELFNSIPKEKIIEEKGTRKHIMEEYKRKWAHKDEKYYKAETEFNLLQELLKDGGE